MDAGPHANDPELRDVTLQLLVAVADEPDGERAAELLETYEALVYRRRLELIDDRDGLRELELDHAIVIIDAGEAMGLGAWSGLQRAAEETGLDPIALLRDLARNAPDEATRDEARRALRQRGVPFDEGG